MLLTYHLWRWFIKKEFLWFLFLNSLNYARLPGHLDTFKTHEMELNIDTLTHRRLTPGALWFVTFSCVQIAAFCPWQVVVKSVVRSPTFWKFFQVAKRESSINYEHHPKNLKNCHKYGPQKTHFLERVFFWLRWIFSWLKSLSPWTLGRELDMLDVFSENGRRSFEETVVASQLNHENTVQDPARILPKKHTLWKSTSCKNQLIWYIGKYPVVYQFFIHPNGAINSSSQLHILRVPRCCVPSGDRNWDP